MVSLSCSASPFQSTLGFHRPNHIPTITVLKLGFTKAPTALNFRVKNGIRLQVRQRLLKRSASNTNSSDGDSLKEESDVRKIGDANQCPSFFAILGAGVLVIQVIHFMVTWSIPLFLSWVTFSLVLWLIDLIVHLPPSK